MDLDPGPDPWTGSRIPDPPRTILVCPKEQSFIIAHNRLIIIKLDQSLIIKGPRVPKGPKGPKGQGSQRAHKNQKSQGSQRPQRDPRYKYLRAKGPKRGQRGPRYKYLRAKGPKRAQRGPKMSKNVQKLSLEDEITSIRGLKT